MNILSERTQFIIAIIVIVIVVGCAYFFFAFLNFVAFFRCWKEFWTLLRSDRSKLFGKQHWKICGQCISSMTMDKKNIKTWKQFGRSVSVQGAGIINHCYFCCLRCCYLLHTLSGNVSIFKSDVQFYCHCPSIHGATFQWPTCQWLVCLVQSAKANCQKHFMTVYFLFGHKITWTESGHSWMVHNH